MTRQQAINEKCKECNYDPEAEGTWKTQTEACDLTDCGLWPYRPKPRRKTPYRRLSATVPLQYAANQPELRVSKGAHCDGQETLQRGMGGSVQAV